MKECRTCKHLRSEFYNRYNPAPSFTGMHLWCNLMHETPEGTEPEAARIEGNLLNQETTCSKSQVWIDPRPDEALSNAAVVRCHLEAHYRHKLIYRGDGTVPSGEVAVALLIHVLRSVTVVRLP